MRLAEIKEGEIMALISLAEFSKKHNKNDSYMRELAREGKIPAYKIGKMWVIDENAVVKDRRLKENKERK